MSRRISLALVLMLAAVSILLSVVINDLSGSLPVLRTLRDWSLPALGVLAVLFLLGQGLLHQLEQREGPDAVPRPRWVGRRPPYPGLEPFTEGDAAVFFGREAETRELLGRLSPTVASEAHRLVTVVGPSGSGKSSLVHAGLIPALARQRRPWIVLPMFSPEDRPIQGLRQSLTSQLPEVPFDGSVAGLVACIERLCLSRGGRSARVLMVVDQAEELLTLTPPGERDAFLQLLREALERDRRLWVVATLRSEFLDGFLSAGFTDLFHQPVVVGSPDRAALFEMIQRPAAEAGLRFAPGLVNRIVDDTGGGDALPMLAYTLQALYLRVGSGGIVTETDYRQLGGVAGALSEQADRVAAELQDTSSVLNTLMRFVSMDESGPIPRPVLASALAEPERRVVDAFIGARLLTSDVQASGAVIQVAHEALFRQWPPLRQAVEAGAETLRRRAQLERWAQDWIRSGRRDSYLLTGERLETARQWALAALAREQPAVGEFLDQSTRLDRRSMTLLSQTVAQQSLASLARDPELATLLALAAIEECGLTPIAYRALATAVVNPCLRVVRGHGDSLWAIAWSPDGRRLVTASEDGLGRAWEVDGGGRSVLLRGHEDGVLDVAWSPDGGRILTGSRDCTARVWDAGGGAELLQLRHTARVRGVSWAPAGGRLAVALEDATARVWELAGASELLVLRGHEDWLRAVAWSPDGTRIATASRDRTARVWGALDGEERLVVRGHGDSVVSAAWSPDSRLLVTGSADRTARVWDAASGRELMALRGHDDVVRSVAWSPDGRWVVTSSDDQTARLWDAGRGTCLTVLRGHESSVRMAAWSPVDLRLATISEDRSVRLWAIERGGGLPAVLRGHTSTVQDAAWSPEGGRLASGSRDGTARVWDAGSGAELLLLEHQGTVRAVAWSPEGRRLATASADRTAQIWDAESGEALVVIRGHDDSLRDVAWAPEGRRLATASEDRTARVWDADSGRELLVLRGHRDQVRGVAWDPDGRRIATVSRDRTGRVWDGERGTQLLELQGHEAIIRAIAWSPEGRRIATVADDGSARLWDAADGRPLAVLRGHENWVRGVAWSPDGRRLATVSADRTVRTWDLDRETELAVVGVHAEMVEAVDWSPEGRRIASASRDATIRIWDANCDLECLMQWARRRVSRQLTPAERRDAMLTN